jgi:hypothetical protein
LEIVGIVYKVTRVTKVSKVKHSAEWMNYGFLFGCSMDSSGKYDDNFINVDMVV